MLTSPSTKRNVRFRDKLFVRCFEPEDRDREILRAVNDRFSSLSSINGNQMVELMHDLRQSVCSGASVTDDEIMIPALALAKQALKRTVNMTAYDVQILAGIALCRGAICEMKTGEGKTLASVFPIVVHALTGKGVHVATVNAYLAERDYQFIGPALRFLGFTAGISKDGDSIPAKSEAYRCDVTFATGYELGFDFLRDQISLMSRGSKKLGAKLRSQLSSPTDDNKPDECQRGHVFAIIDEADSVLIDEAITPLVLSSGELKTKADILIYHAAHRAAAQLHVESDFFIDAKTKALFLTESGSEKAHALQDAVMKQIRGEFSSAGLGSSDTTIENREIRNQFDMLADLERAQQWNDSQDQYLLYRPWRNYVESALRAQHIMTRDINYVVRDDRVQIVDEYTGRIFSDRHWRDGLHQAVETKEDVPITEEKQTLARISRQRYFQRYEMLCGMTGTASGNHRELMSCYGMPTIVIPLRKQSRRVELSPRYFSSEEAKINSILVDVKQRNGAGQPVLVGTRTIDQSIRLSKRLLEEGIRHQVLNGIQDAEEASLVANAGYRSCVTVATNMAGRGTDIKPTPGALDSGGLHVIGFERNFSRRIDRQLLGRAGRQGDPGSGQFFISADDEIIQRYAPRLADALRRLGNSQEGQSNQQFDHRIRKIQDLAERESYRSRRQVMREELWLDKVKKTLG